MSANNNIYSFSQDPFLDHHLGQLYDDEGEGHIDFSGEENEEPESPLLLQSLQSPQYHDEQLYQRSEIAARQPSIPLTLVPVQSSPRRPSASSSVSDLFLPWSNTNLDTTNAVTPLPSPTTGMITPQRQQQSTFQQMKKSFQRVKNSLPLNRAQERHEKQDAQRPFQELRDPPRQKMAPLAATASSSTSTLSLSLPFNSDSWSTASAMTSSSPAVWTRLPPPVAHPFSPPPVFKGTTRPLPSIPSTLSEDFPLSSLPISESSQSVGPLRSRANTIPTVTFPQPPPPTTPAGSVTNLYPPEQALAESLSQPPQPALQQYQLQQRQQQQSVTAFVGLGLEPDQLQTLFERLFKPEFDRFHESMDQLWARFEHMDAIVNESKRILDGLNWPPKKDDEDEGTE